MTTFTASTLTIAALAAVSLLAGCHATGSATRASMGALSGGGAGAGHVCPLTGETLPCPECCPLNQGSNAAQIAGEPKAFAEKGYECPLTGEILPCPKCCPLNKDE